LICDRHRRFAAIRSRSSFDGIGPNSPNNCHELDDIDPPLAALVLRPLELARQLVLSQAGLVSGSHHQGQKAA
jgi:hypothetical protein